MKGQTLGPDQLFALLVNAETKGYTFSEYHYQATPPNVDTEKLPQMIEIKEDGTLGASIQFYKERFSPVKADNYREDVIEPQVVARPAQDEEAA